MRGVVRPIVAAAAAAFGLASGWLTPCHHCGLIGASVSIALVESAAAWACASAHCSTNVVRRSPKTQSLGTVHFCGNSDQSIGFTYL